MILPARRRPHPEGEGAQAPGGPPRVYLLSPSSGESIGWSGETGICT